MRVVLKLVKSLALVFVVLVIVMFAINWSDQPPSPAALKMQSILDEGSGVPDEENAYIYVMGFAAPRLEDPVRVGVECIAKLNAAIHKQTINYDDELSCDYDYPHKTKSADISKILDVCTTPNADCETAMQENEQDIVQWLENESWLLQRYEKLLEFGQWHTTAEYSILMLFPPYERVNVGRKMLLLKAWHLAGRGESAEVQRLLDRDVKFWRMVLSSSETILDRMIATAFLGGDFAFANLVFRRMQENDVSEAIPVLWQVPFSRDELSPRKMIAGEWAFSSSILRDIPFVGTEELNVLEKRMNDLLGYFLLFQDTQNNRAEMLLRLVEILDVQVNQLSQALQQAEAYSNDLSSTGNVWSLYNPVGHFMNYISVPAYSEYTARVYDLEGVRQALLVTTKLREDGISADQVAIALKRSELKNPYDGKTFVWDADTRSIIFKGLWPEERNTHSFLY
jgi:hypothetical protein